MSGTATVRDLEGSDGYRLPVSIPDHALLRVIGRGSYGEVWEATNVMGTPRAIKIVRREDFDSARPFEREFEGIQRYEPVSRTHAGLVHVLHVGMGPGGDYFYYVMELADAAPPEDPGDTRDEYAPKTLRSELNQRNELPVSECIEIGMTLASALGHLHRAGLVHRDVKPSNIIFVAGIPKLADVGLVARLSDSRSMVGTEGYFAPEGTGQPRSDVFSLGKVLYECVTGMDRTCFPDVPDHWSSGAETKAAFEFMEIVLRAAESNPDRRYDGTEEMLADLALLKAGKSLRYLRRVETRLRRTLQVLTFSAIAIAIAGSAWFYEHYRRGQVEAAQRTAAVAQQQTQRLLGESLVAEARAVRLSGQAGAREKALAAVIRGREAGAALTELRTQAASALALTDVGSFSPREPADFNRRSVWSADGAHLAVCTGDGSLRISDRESDRTLAELAVPPDIADIALSRGAKWLAVVHRQRKLTLWDVAGGRIVWEQPITSPPHLPAFSQDGEWLVMSTADGLTARASAGGEPVTIVPGAPAMRHLLLAPNGKWVAALPEPVKEGAAEKDLGFRIYTGLPGRLPAAAGVAAIKASEIASDIRLEGPGISADSRFLSAAVAEDRLRVWEIPSLAQVAWLRGHQRSVRGTAFHPDDSSMVASTSWDGTTRLWNIPTRREVLVAPAGGDAVMLVPGRSEILLRTWSGESVRSAALSPASALRVLMLPTNTRFGLFSGCGFNRDGSLFAAAGDAGVILWDLRDGSAHTARSAAAPQEWRDAVFDPAGTGLWCSGRTGVFRHAISRDAAGHPVIGKPETILTGWAGDLEWIGTDLAVSGRFTGDRKACVELVRPGGPPPPPVLSPLHTPDSLAVSADGRWMAASGYPFDGGTLWDLSNEPPSLTRITAAGRAAFGFCSSSPAVMVGTDREVRFDRLPGLKPPGVHPLGRKHSEVIPGRSFQSPDGNLVAISTGPDELTLCDGHSLAPLLTLDSPLTPFDCVMTFSPDSTRLALAGGVSRVVIWEIAWLKEELTRLGLGW